MAVRTQDGGCGPFVLSLQKLLQRDTLVPHIGVSGRTGRVALGWTGGTAFSSCPRLLRGNLADLSAKQASAYHIYPLLLVQTIILLRTISCVKRGT